MARPKRARSKTSLIARDGAIGFVRATRSGHSVVVSIPRSIREAVGIAPGHFVRVAVKGEEIVLRKAI